MKRFLILGCFIIASCSSDENVVVINNTNLLSTDVEGKPIETGSVIACAANQVDDENIVEIYFYPEGGSNNFKLYETNKANVDPNDFSNYKQVNIVDTPFFNGYLRKFERPFALEQWLIVTYELDGEIKVSNPIRTKNNTQPTFYSNNVAIDQTESLMPEFAWESRNEMNTAIFFSSDVYIG